MRTENIPKFLNYDGLPSPPLSPVRPHQTLKRERQQAREATAALAADLMRAKAQWEARERQLKQVG